MHDHPGIWPPLPTVEPDPEMWEFTQRAHADDPEWLTCWEFMLTHNLTDSEGAAFWQGANLANAAVKRALATPAPTSDGAA